MKKTILSISVLVALSLSMLAKASNVSEDKFNNFETKAKESAQRLSQDKDIKNQISGMTIPSVNTYDLNVPRFIDKSDPTMSRWGVDTRVNTGQLGYLSVGFEVEFNIQNEARSRTMGGLIGRDTAASTMVRSPTSVAFDLIDADTNTVVLSKVVVLEKSIIPNRDRGNRKSSVFESAVSVNLLAGDSMTGLKKYHEYIVRPKITLNSIVKNDELGEQLSGTFVNQAKLTVVGG
ncbi:hypothetical protein GLP31_15840 [Photobacterium carnosum]|uniref:hypothetical protein n=1 Tax=Photobacterium carnosum TaxID=2023717 RepID=UPI001E4C2898|nr:hypothetical protein [Photobacterium carnosum]MCD9553944.1 hypothetical protein [Photobacterium carnosum]